MRKSQNDIAIYKNKNNGFGFHDWWNLLLQVFLNVIKLPYTFRMLQIIRRVDQIHPCTKRPVYDLFIFFSIVFLYIFFAKADNIR